MLKKSGVGIFAAALLAASATYGSRWWTQGRFLERTDNAYVEADISIVAPKVAGYVRQVRITDNEVVTSGSELAVIDDRELQAHFDEAEARLATRRAALETLDRESALQRSAVARASADLESASAEHERARLDLARYRELSRNRLISQQQLERSGAETTKTQAALASAHAALAVEQRRVDVVAARRKEAQAAVIEMQAALALAALDVENATVRAPMDGVVGNRMVRVGQYVTAGTPMMAIAPLQSVYVVANFKETQLERMRPGQSVALELDAYPATPLTGIVESFAPAAGSRFTILPPQNATGNFTKIVQRIPVRIGFSSRHPLVGKLRPGMSVVATVDVR
jgi:membrane fusion protein (multidrug efflux system)